MHPPVKAKQPPVEPSGPSHGGVALAAPTPRETQRRFSSDDDDDPTQWAPRRLGLVRRGRGGGRTDRTHARTRRRLPANPFVEMEAEEGDEEESGSESSPRCAVATANTQTLTTSHPSDEGSSDCSDLEDSFICGDDWFE